MSIVRTSRVRGGITAVILAIALLSTGNSAALGKTMLIDVLGASDV